MIGQLSFSHMPKMLSGLVEYDKAKDVLAQITLRTVEQKVSLFYFTTNRRTGNYNFCKKVTVLSLFDNPC